MVVYRSHFQLSTSVFLLPTLADAGSTSDVSADAGGVVGEMRLLPGLTGPVGGGLGGGGVVLFGGGGALKRGNEARVRRSTVGLNAAETDMSINSRRQSKRAVKQVAETNRDGRPCLCVLLARRNGVAPGGAKVKKPLCPLCYSTKRCEAERRTRRGMNQMFAAAAAEAATATATRESYRLLSSSQAQRPWQRS